MKPSERPHTPLEKTRLVLEVLSLYVRTQVLVRRRGLEMTIERLRAAPCPAPIAEHEAVAYGQRLGQVVSRVLRPLPSDTRCLARSLVLTGMLARRGVPASLIIGVSPGPDFQAHAWVEHERRPLLPTGDGAFGRLTEI